MGSSGSFDATAQQESVYSSWAGSSKLACLPERAAYTAAKVSSLSDTSYGLSRDTLMVLLPSRAQRMRLPLMLAGYTRSDRIASCTDVRVREDGRTWFFLNRSLRRYGTKITIAAVLLLTTTSLAPAMCRFLRKGRSSSLLISRSTNACATWFSNSVGSPFSFLIFWRAVNIGPDLTLRSPC